MSCDTRVCIDDVDCHSTVVQIVRKTHEVAAVGGEAHQDPSSRPRLRWKPAHNTPYGSFLTVGTLEAGWWPSSVLASRLADSSLVTSKLAEDVNVSDSSFGASGLGLFDSFFLSCSQTLHLSIHHSRGVVPSFGVDDCEVESDVREIRVRPRRLVVLSASVASAGTTTSHCDLSPASHHALCMMWQPTSSSFPRPSSEAFLCVLSFLVKVSQAPGSHCAI